MRICPRRRSQVDAAVSRRVSQRVALAWSDQAPVVIHVDEHPTPQQPVAGDGQATVVVSRFPLDDDVVRSVDYRPADSGLVRRLSRHRHRPLAGPRSLVTRVGNRANPVLQLFPRVDIRIRIGTLPCAAGCVGTQQTPVSVLFQTLQLVGECHFAVGQVVPSYGYLVQVLVVLRAETAYGLRRVVRSRRRRPGVRPDAPAVAAVGGAHLIVPGLFRFQTGMTLSITWDDFTNALRPSDSSFPRKRETRNRVISGVLMLFTPTPYLRKGRGFVRSSYNWSCYAPLKGDVLFGTARRALLRLLRPTQ